MTQFRLFHIIDSCYLINYYSNTYAAKGCYFKDPMLFDNESLAKEFAFQQGLGRGPEEFEIIEVTGVSND